MGIDESCDNMMFNSICLMLQIYTLVDTTHSYTNTDMTIVVGTQKISFPLIKIIFGIFLSKLQINDNTVQV